MSQQEKSNQFLIVTGVSSVISSMISKLIVHPIDTLKAKVQIESSKINIKGQLRQILINTIQKEGISGLYQGMSIATIGLIPAMSLFFVSYEKSKNTLDQYKYMQQNQSINFFISGMIAEAVSCIFFVPIDIIKERFQVQTSLNTFKYLNNMDAFRQIINSEGILGLYRAYGATISSFGPFSALHMMFYEKLKQQFCNDAKSPQFSESMLLSALSGSLASVITNPLDMAKMRMQVQRGANFDKTNFQQGSIQLKFQGNFGYKNMFHGIYLIYQNEGFFSLYKGSLARVLYHCPNVAIIMSLMEYFRKIILLNLDQQKL